MNLSINNERDYLFLYVLNKITEAFPNYAILKGGMMLRLFNCPRHTLDLDFVFVPFKSKKDIYKDLLNVLSKLDDVQLKKSINSKSIRIIIQRNKVSIQVEANVAMDCKTKVVSTNALSDKVNQLPKVIKVMSPDSALSHKICAWNERRLYRDLYDIHFFVSVLNVKPDIKILNDRLKKFNSNLPKLKKIKSMSIDELKNELMYISKTINEKELFSELELVIDRNLLYGMKEKIQISINSLLNQI